MNRFFLIILAILSCCISKAGKPDSIIVSGFVMDEFTRINMDSVRITLMETDSSIISVTETWYNTIPSYVMLHLIYRLNVLPKGNK